MRQSQKTENKADHQWKDSLEDEEYVGARSATVGENTAEDGISFKELVLDDNNINRAYHQVKKNKGAAGIDGMTINDLQPYLDEHQRELCESLRAGTYKPKPVKRVEIPKPNGTMRKLGIPTVVDRMVQQAVAQVMTPIFEQVFSDNSFGFRPNRSASDAMKRVIQFYNQGYKYVVDLDLKAYFDTVNHDLLMKFISRQIDDPWLLRLIRRFLTSGVMKGETFEKSKKGTPQGGNLSPLLANIYLNELDQLLTDRGHVFVRYADDCNIYVKSKRAGYRVLENITRYLEDDLKVTVNQDKSQVGSPAKLKFLGFSIGVTAKGAYVRTHKVARQRVKRELKLITRRNRSISWEQLTAEINQKMNGWLQYYSISKMATFIKHLDEWLRSRIRQLLWKRWKNIKTRRTKLVSLGMSREDARIFASTRKGYWRIAHSKTLTYTLTNKKLESIGLINLTKTLQRIQNA